MTKQNYYNHASLRQSSPAGSTHSLLPANQAITIGSDRKCQIFLDSSQYSSVSQHHVEIRPLISPNPGSLPLWQVCDLGSASGTYVNNQKLHGCRILQAGDRIALGQNGTEFIFEYQTSYIRPTTQPLVLPNDDSLHLSQIFPIFSTKQDLLQKAYLIPGAITILVVVGLFASIGNPPLFNALLAVYLISIAYYFIYQISGKSKPWWVLLGSAFLTIFLLISPVLGLFIFIFRYILPGNIPEDLNIGFLSLFIRMFFGAGMMEELLKAIPVFIALWLGQKRLKTPWRERVGVWEPLDGILLATASAAGFTVIETLGQYVPGIVSDIAAQSGEGMGELVGLQLLIPRIVGSVAGHMAYSGYFGYFIGLSVLKPSKRWSLLTIGYLTSSFLHALWNASSVLGSFVTAFAGILAYVFLMAAILKARQLSPTRFQNWATQYVQNLPIQSSFLLKIQKKTISLKVGAKIRARQVPGLVAQKSDGVVAEVNVNPQDPNILGLQNCSQQAWLVTLANGQQKRVAKDRSIKIAMGTKINFGNVEGEISQ